MAGESSGFRVTGDTGRDGDRPREPVSGAAGVIWVHGAGRRGAELSPPPGIGEIAVDARSLASLRRAVQAEARMLGMARQRAWDLVMAVHELALNSVVHGGGHGAVAIWREGDAIACQVRDAGVINDPAVGRAPPLPLSTSGRGIWIVHQLCDSVQVQSSSRGTVVRISMSLADA